MEGWELGLVLQPNTQNCDKDLSPCKKKICDRKNHVQNFMGLAMLQKLLDISVNIIYNISVKGK